MFWLMFVWLYLMPLDFNVLENLQSFWFFLLGLAYCTFPLNFLVYSLNDLFDVDTDRANERKGNFVFGSVSDQSKHQIILLTLILTNAPFIAAFCGITGDIWYITWFLLVLAVNVLYSVPPFTVSRKAPVELPVVVLGHFLIPIFSRYLNNVEQPMKPANVGFHVFLLLRTQLWLAMMDEAVDRKVKKVTTAVLLGRKRTEFLVLGLIMLESIMGFQLSYKLGFFSLFGILIFVFMEMTKRKIDKKFACISQSFVGGIVIVSAWLNREFI
jgi:4-hydroxybenzoate polyprenyltransferase